MLYELFCQSVQGAGHIEKGMPCEDYGVKFENETCKIFALGDGHGDLNCPRSSFGSRAICEIAVDELQLFAKEIKNHDWEEQLLDKYHSSELVNQLVTSIFGKWSCRVNEDYAQNPLSEKEESDAKEYIERYRRGERIEHIYGTTFIAALLTEKYLLLLQQGDGRCVVFNHEGNASQPIPWDDRCFANVTTSVCDVDAVPSCRYHIIDLKQNPIIACVAGSDGVEDSFGSMDKMHAYYRSKLQIACESGVEELERHLAETLPSFSAEGSKDDTTICGIIERSLFNDKLDKLIADNEVVIVNDAISKAQEHIDSMTPKLSFLHKKCVEVEAQHSNLKNKYAELEKEYASIKRDLDIHAQNKANAHPSIKGMIFSAASVKCLQKRMERIMEEIEEVAKEIRAIYAKKKNCDEEYSAYKKKYDAYASTIKEYEARIKMLGTSSCVQTDESVHKVTEILNETDGVNTCSESDTIVPSDQTKLRPGEVLCDEVAVTTTETEGVAVDATNLCLQSTLSENKTLIDKSKVDIGAEGAADDDTASSEIQLITEMGSADIVETGTDHGEVIATDSKIITQVDVQEQGVIAEKEKKTKSGFFSNFKKNKP